MLSLKDGTYSRDLYVAPWCVAVRCIGLFLARTHWSRSMNPIHKQVQLKMDIPLSYKRTRPWRGRLGPVRTQHQNHTTSPCSLEKGGKKNQLFNYKCSKSVYVLKLSIFENEWSFVGNIQTGSIFPHCFGHYEEVQQTNALGSKKEPSVQQTDALTHLGENLPPPPMQSKQGLLLVMRWLPHKNTEKALIWNLWKLFFFFNLL